MQNKEKFLQTEIEGLKEKLRNKDEERKEAYHREDKYQRQNAAIK